MMAELNELDIKLLEHFRGYVVKKDLVRLVKVGANVPVFVLEYLIANSCSTDDEEQIRKGRAVLAEVVQVRERLVPSVEGGGHVRDGLMLWEACVHAWLRLDKGGRL
jgi:predicted ATP-dependent Lon-type protease